VSGVNKPVHMLAHVQQLIGQIRTEQTHSLWSI
jgi:hypothetical protein